MSIELKPCPFCGSKDITYQSHEDSCGRFGYVTVWCMDCEAEGPPHDWKKTDEEECLKETTELWNRRTNELS
jgi:Lar family restriction alleviation protein